MTIYIVYTDYTLCAEYFDDKSLKKMIKDIAHVLCNVHHIFNERKILNIDKGIIIEVPIEYKKYKSFEPLAQWAEWIRECRANYNYLVNLGMHCCIELISYREILECKKYQLAIDLASDNIPDLPNLGGHPRLGYAYMTEFPLVMPKKYLKIYPYSMVQVIDSYRNYYQEKINNHLTKFKHYDFLNWTKRKKPDWLSI